MFRFVLIIYLLTSLIYLNTAHAFNKNSVVIEIGEDHILNQVRSKIWIENSKFFSARQINQSVVVKALDIGYSKIKIDQKIYHFYAVPAGYKFSFETWKLLVRKIPNLTATFCQISICLKGKISKLSEFKKIIELMQIHKSYIYLDLKISSHLEQEIEKYIAQYLRKNEIKPNKVLFRSSPWKMLYSGKEKDFNKSLTLLKVGLFLEKSDSQLSLDDNVKLEVQFIEIKKGLFRNLGTQWPDQLTARANGQIVDSAENILLQLNAAESSGESKILANPTLICRSGKEAEFLAGGEIPIKIINPRSREVIWKKYGLHLKFKPLIDPMGQMSIEITTEISTPDFSKAIDGIPTLYTNKVSSYFDLVESKTIVISGLIQSDLQKSKTGLPYLSQLPVLGLLFSSQSFLDNQTELVITVKPSLVED